ncbi:hypothetical protein EMPS_01594 [Entomortierella parvispora]|uniref:Flavin reductase like domain-containing protein n=1 Tax=Entomortierella parvispora TaxID=205924 RepID=A0A9P3LSR2_9FUNG|nr:hypothetical protein EMPS_01594 [Entomortierella parvispora]
MFSKPLQTRWHRAHSLAMCHPSTLTATPAVHLACRRALFTVQPRSITLPSRDTHTRCKQRTSSLALTPTRPYTSSSVNPNIPQENHPTSEKLRKVLRNVPFPVVVVSTASKSDPSLRRGITVSSFTSISLQPIPLVAFCVKLPSRASTVLHDSKGFVIQFLASDQIAHSVAFSSSVPPPTARASPDATSLSPSPGEQTSENARGRALNQGRDKDIDDLVSEASQQTLINSSRNKDITSKQPEEEAESAVLSRDNKMTTETDPDPFEVLGYNTDPESQLPVLTNTLGAIRCKTHQVMVVGDHEMWIGEVEKVLHGGDDLLLKTQEPLLYHDRSYRKVGKRIY